eukprot:403361433
MLQDLQKLWEKKQSIHNQVELAIQLPESKRQRKRQFPQDNSKNSHATSKNRMFLMRSDTRGFEQESIIEQQNEDEDYHLFFNNPASRLVLSGNKDNKNSTGYLNKIVLQSFEKQSQSSAQQKTYDFLRRNESEKPDVEDLMSALSFQESNHRHLDRVNSDQIRFTREDQKFKLQIHTDSQDGKFQVEMNNESFCDESNRQNSNSILIQKQYMMFQNSFELDKKMSTQSSTKFDSILRSKSSDIVGCKSNKRNRLLKNLSSFNTPINSHQRQQEEEQQSLIKQKEEEEITKFLFQQ